ncbi:dTDP-glucose 4,6-dehydratase [compost metagenome]
MILVTGASGYIGSSLCRVLIDQGLDVVATGRKKVFGLAVKRYESFDLEVGAVADDLCVGVDAVIHLAARAHILKEHCEDPLKAFRIANVYATVRLAEAAIRNGVRRFIYVSSIGVNGNLTQSKGFSEESPKKPSTPYALSKCEAENALLAMMSGSKTELVIIRPPMVYAGDAPGNFQRLLKLVHQGFPLPFKEVGNQRSIIALENLLDFIVLCIFHPRAAGEVFLVSDGQDVSISDIVERIAEGMGKSVRLIHIPLPWVEKIAKLLGKQAIYNQLYCSLQIDSSRAQILLGWTPPVSVREALIAAGRSYRVARLVGDSKC